MSETHTPHSVISLDIRCQEVLCCDVDAFKTQCWKVLDVDGPTKIIYQLWVSWPAFGRILR